MVSSRGFQINGGGLALLADTELAVGDEAEIVLADYNVTLRAVVRNRTGNHCGVKFLATTPQEAEELARFRQDLSKRMGCLYA